MNAPSGGGTSDLLELCLDRWARSDPDQEALLDSGRRITYCGAQQLATRFARSLLHAGIGRGDRVAVLGHSRIDCFVAFLGIASIGAIYVGMNPKYRERELTHVITDSQPAVLLVATSPTHTPALGSLLRDHETTKVVALESDDAELHGWVFLDEWLRAGDTLGEDELAAARSVVAANDPAAIIYTSGTTGAPKGALLPHRALLHAAAMSARSMWRGVPRTLVDLPINHVAWLVETCLAATYAGGTLYFRERFDPAETLRVVERERLNSLLLIGSMLIACSRTEEFGRLDLSSVEHLLFVPPVDHRLLKAVKDRFGATLVTGLGMTETSGGYTFTDANADLDTVVTTVGRADPSVEIKIVDEQGRPLGPGQPGEILVRSESLFLGYLNRPQATAETFDEEGFLRTGDVAVMRPDGNIEVIGRRTEMFKSGGYNVYPSEIEMVLADHQDIAAAAVVPVPDEMWGEIGVAFVTPRTSTAAPSEENLRSFAREHLANYKVPKLFVILSELPVLPNGKFDRSALRRRAIERYRADSSPERPAT